MEHLKRIGRRFFQRYTPEVARALVGCQLVKVANGQRLSGMIVETEAYRGSRDPASHAYRGMTSRNEVMFGPPGHAYVYFTMGMHYCLNITTEQGGIPAAVLIRSIEPQEGLGVMMRNRGVYDVLRLASGPGNLTKAMGIDKNLNGEDIVNSRRLFLEHGRINVEVGTSTRIGVSAAWSRPWRFYMKENSFVSKGRPTSQPITHN